MQSVLGKHEGQDEPGDSQSAVDIDLQDVVNFLWRCLVEIDGHIVRAANVVYSKGLSVARLGLVSEGVD